MQRTSQGFRATWIAVALLLVAIPIPTRCVSARHRASLLITLTPQASLNGPEAKPAPAPTRWRGLIGEYGPDNDILIILEKDGKLFGLFKRTQLESLEEISTSKFKFSAGGAHANQSVVFTRDPHGRSAQVAIDRDV